jgi:hypothetical protein
VIGSEKGRRADRVVIETDVGAEYLTGEYAGAVEKSDRSNLEWFMDIRGDYPAEEVQFAIGLVRRNVIACGVSALFQRAAGRLNRRGTVNRSGGAVGDRIDRRAGIIDILVFAQRRRVEILSVCPDIAEDADDGPGGYSVRVRVRG